MESFPPPVFLLASSSPSLFLPLLYLYFQIFSDFAVLFYSYYPRAFSVRLGPYFMGCVCVCVCVLWVLPGSVSPFPEMEGDSMHWNQSLFIANMPLQLMASSSGLFSSRTHILLVSSCYYAIRNCQLPPILMLSSALKCFVRFAYA